MSSEILCIIGITIFAAYIAGKVVARFNFPSLLGFLIAGIALGPSFANLLTESSLEHLSFVTEIALGFVAFSIGQELSVSSLRRLGRSIVLIILCESFLAFALVATVIYVFWQDLAMAIIFGAVAPASAPAGTVAVIQEYKAKGSLTKALFAVVGFDDGLAILIFAFASAISQGLLASGLPGVELSLGTQLLRAGEEIVFSLIAGAVIGYIFSIIAKVTREDKDISVVLFGVIVLTVGLASAWHLSSILTNMAVGFVLVNTRNEATVRRVANQLMGFMPILFLLFFLLAGAHLQIGRVLSLGLLGLTYIATRTVGLMGGARLGAYLGNAEEKIGKYLGMGILSQAGVAIALALRINQEFDAIGTDRADYIGGTVLATITATCVFFEIVGPVMTRIALKRAGELPEPHG
jgi:Kef-type K+ transport system membrane component KefB